MWLHVYVGVIDVVGCVSVVTRWKQVFSWDWLLGQHVKSLSHVKALWLCDTTCVCVCVCVCQGISEEFEGLEYILDDE